MLIFLFVIIGASATAPAGIFPTQLTFNFLGSAEEKFFGYRISKTNYIYPRSSVLRPAAYTLIDLKLFVIW